MTQPKDTLINSTEVKRQLGKGDTKGFTFIYKEIAEGRLKPIKLGRSTFFSQMEVNEYIENLKNTREAM